MFLEIFLTMIFFIAFGLIILEETLKMNKAKSTLFFGTFVWIVLFLFAGFLGLEHLEHDFEENILEIAILWLFLISAMTFVAYMDKKGFIEKVVYNSLPKKISEKKLMFAIGVFTFIFSSIADNLTATLVSITILLTLKIQGKKLIKYAVLVVFAANAGGVALITGDVTTLMIFLEGKVEMANLLWLFIPSFVSFLVIYFLISRGMNKILVIKKRKNVINTIDIKIAITFLLTIIMIILGHVFYHIPPVLMFLFGLSVMFLIGWHHKRRNNEDLKILDYIRVVEFEALFFFLGVLLLVGMLKEIGILQKVTFLYDFMPISVANYLIGILSSVVDNIPLTAAMLKAGIDMSQSGWIALTYAVGVGGSLLSIGSAAGVVAMCKIKELTFAVYLKYSLYIFIAYTIGYIGAFYIGLIVI